MLLNIWNLELFVAQIGFYIIFCKIDMHPRLLFTPFRGTSHVNPSS